MSDFNDDPMERAATEREADAAAQQYENERAERERAASGCWCGKSGLCTGCEDE